VTPVSAGGPRAEGGTRTRFAPLLALAGASGLLLFLSDHPVRAWPLLFVALVPLLVGLGRFCRSVGAAAVAGLALGLCYTLPLFLVLEFPIAMGAGLALYGTALTVLLSIALRLAAGRPAPVGPLLAGCAATVIEWAEFTLVPVFGTAQCFARVASASPPIVQIVSLFGMTGLVFVLVAGQALLARLLDPAAAGERRRAAVALALLVALVAALDGWLWARTPISRLRVAAVGWTHLDLERAGARTPEAIWDRVYAPLASRAAGRGARLLVSPEVGFFLGAESRREILDRASSFAREHRVALALGYFDRAREDNRIAFFDPWGLARGEYVKTHLIPLVESYRAGDGTPVVLELDGHRVGGMICQDDNFTDLSRQYGRLKVNLLAVPTNDWAQVKDFHLENSLFRPVESGYALVRAASNGVSAIVTARGELLARKDHFVDGPGVLVADLPLYETGSRYSESGDLLVLLCGGGIVAASARALRRRPAA
jgi:apolipoprotein N-acyltransferase